MGNFNASAGNDRDGYETCVGPRGSGNVNLNSTRFVDFARSHGLRVAGSWFQRPQAHRWTWYSNAGGVAKEIDHHMVNLLCHTASIGIPSPAMSLWVLKP